MMENKSNVCHIDNRKLFHSNVTRINVREIEIESQTVPFVFM